MIGKARFAASLASLAHRFAALRGGSPCAMLAHRLSAFAFSAARLASHPCRSAAPLAPLSILLALSFSLTARADVKTLYDQGKIYWANETEVIYLLEGNVSDADNYDEIVLKFTDTETPGSFTIGADTTLSVRSLVVGGGGAGGTSTNTTAGAGGGGGAGGFVDQTQILEAGTYTITVGAGGAAAATLDTTQGEDGGDSSFDGASVSIIAKGGGGGGAQTVGRPGGSGGGGSYASATCNGGTTNGLYYVRGNAGGKGATAQFGGGGGGAGSAGKNTAKTTGPGAGGTGLPSDIILDANGDAIYYAGGGGGGSMTSKQSAKSKGGGGAGAKGGDSEAGAGDDGFGGGGGGGGNACVGGKGGDGVVILRIRDLFIDVPEYVELEWDGENQIGYEPKGYYEFVGGTTNATLVNTYTYQIKPAGEFEWKDGTGKEIKTVEWKITALQVDIPTSVVITYDGVVHEVASSDEIYEIVDGTATSTNAGEYYYTLHLLDIANTVWSDGTTTDKTTPWSIVAKQVEKPTPVEGLIYSGTNSIVFTEYDGVVYKSGETNSVNAGSFDYTVALDNPVGYTNYVWAGESGEKSVENVRIDWEIKPYTVDVPVPLTGLVYNGSPQNAFENLDWSLYELVTGSTTNETEGGTYEAVFHLTGNSETENYVWNTIPTKTSLDQIVPWSISADTNEIYSLKLDGWRLDASPNTPTIDSKWGADTVVYSYGFGDDAESVTSWTNDTDAITTVGTWVLRAVIPEKPSWTAVTNYTTFVMWDDPSMLFRNRVEIFVKGTTSELSDFVVPIRISEDSMQGFYYDDANSTGLVFIDNLGNLLSYDVDTWNTSGESVVWVKLVTLPTDGMPITMYWNLKEGCVAPKNTPADVWSDYAGVWHMTGAIDSAAGASTGTLGNKTTAVDGVFGGALSASEQGEPLILATASEAVNSVTGGAFTVSFYTKYNSTSHGSAAQYLFSRRTVLGDAGYALCINGGLTSSATQFIECFGEASGRYTITDASAMTRSGSDKWVRNDVVYTPNVFYWYINGEDLHWSRSMSAGFSNGTTGLLGIGGLAAAGSDSNINGAMDEFRIYSGTPDVSRISAEYKYQTDLTMITNGVVYLDNLQVDYWVVEPAMDKTQWDMSDAEKGQITNYGQLRYGEVTNYIYSVYDESEVYSSVSEITKSGTYRAVFARMPTEDFQPLEYVIEFRITQSKPYTKIGGTNGNSGRVLLMNRDTNTGVPTKDRCPIDRQGYSDTSSTQSTFWQIFGTDEDGLSFNLKPGPDSILWTRNYGEKLWHLENCRHGNTYPTGVGSGGLEPNQNYLPYSSTSRSIIDRNADADQSTAGQVVMRNMVGSTVYSPCYTNGIGTIYFDAVNGWAGITENNNIIVEIATNTIAGLPPTDVNCMTTNEEAGVVTTNWYGNLDDTCWHSVTNCRVFVRDNVTYGDLDFHETNSTEVISLQMASGGAANNFYRIVVPIDYHGPIRFRIRRISSFPPMAYDVDEGGLILIDNIIASIPAMGASLKSHGLYDEDKVGKQELGWELATSVPYPAINDAEILGGAIPSYYTNAGDGSVPDTGNFFKSATMHYRWRYLNQSSGPWSAIDLNPNNGFKALSKFDLPGRACDVEYWYEYTLQAPFYAYVDYSGVGKQIDYSEERGTLTNALNSATVLPSAGTNWFFRVREGKSDYAGVDIVFKRGDSDAAERVHMALAGDHVWRGFLQTKEDQAGDITYRIEALNYQTEPFAEYSCSTNYLYCKTDKPKFPVSDSLESGSEESWSTLTLDAVTGYVMFQIDDSSMALTIVHADYQDANNWSDARNRKGRDKNGNSVEQIFVGTSTTNAYKVGVSPMKQTFIDDFSSWGNMAATNESWTFPIGLTDIQPDHMHGRTPYVTFASGSDTNGVWEVGQGMWVAQKYMVATDNAGVALQMEGNGKGYLQFTSDEKAPRGLESISFNARLGQFVQFDDFNYYDGETKLSLTNYTFLTRSAFDLNSNKNFDGNASLSLVAHYVPNKGCYEARWECIGGNPKNKDTKGGQRLCLYRWNVLSSGTKESKLLVAWTNASTFAQNTASGFNSTATFMPFYITVSNDTDKACTWVAAAVRSTGVTLSGALSSDTAGWYIVAYRDSDQTSRHRYGTYGVLSANCEGVFGKPEYSTNVTFKAEDELKLAENKGGYYTSSKSRAIPGTQIRSYGFGTDDTNWNIVRGRMMTTNVSTHEVGILAAPTPQRLSIYIGPAGKANWEKAFVTNHLDLATFGGKTFNIPFYTTKDCAVKFEVGGTIHDVRTDVVIDTVVMKQWRGGNWNGSDVQAEKIAPSWTTAGSGILSPALTNFVFTSCWTKDNDVLMSAKRSNLDMPCAIRSPLMDYMANNGIGGDGYHRGIGLGMVAIEYANAQSNTVLSLQVATNNVEYSTVDLFDKSFDERYWDPITNYDFSAMSPAERTKGVLNTYLGFHSVTGMLRIVVSSNVVAKVANTMDTSAFGEVTIKRITCSDEPPVDVHSWWGWNMRTLGGDEDAEKRMLLYDFPSASSAAGLSIALNNSVDAENCQVSKIDYDDHESYIQHKPFVQTPTFTSNIVGEVSFKARKYSSDDGIATVALFGSKNASATNEGTWQSIDGAVFSITNDWYETYSYKTDPGQEFKAFRLAVIGIEGVTDASGGGPGTLPEGRKPERVLLDELFVSEAIRARMGFKNVGCFRSDMSGLGEVPNVPSREEQPLCGEAWGVQCEIYGAQLASDIDFDHTPRVRLHWFDKGSGVVTGGWSPWGYDKWKDEGSYHKSAWLVQATGVEEGRYVYRSSLMKSPESVIAMSTAAPTYVQYMLEVIFYTKGSSVPVTNFLSRAEWGDNGKGPEWYRPLDLNAQNGGPDGSFTAYNILDSVAPGWAWINEVNVFGIFNEYLENSDETCQYVEIAQPPEADLSGWSLRILEAQTSNDLVVTNTLATFGDDGLDGRKDAQWIDPTANMVFRVIANRQAQTSGQLKRSEGTLDGVWKLENTYLTNMSGDSNGDTTISVTKPFGLQLVRKSGIVEHELVAMGTNWWNDLSIIYQRQYHPTNAVNFLNAKIADAHFFYLGVDDDGGEPKSLGVFQSNGGTTNDWNNTMNKTPGRKNTLQYIDPDHPVPSGESVLVYFSVSGENIQQWDGTTFTNGLVMTMVPKGSLRGTNITYRVAPWYEISTVTTNGVSAAGNLVQTTAGNVQPREYVLDGVGKGVSNNVTVVAAAAPDSRLATQYGVDEDNPYRDAIVDWLGGGTDLYGNPFADGDSGEIRLAEFRSMNNTFVTNMTLTEMYWLDMDPTVGKLALLGGMAEAPTSRDVTYPGGVTRTYLRMGVFMMITNENAVVTPPSHPRGVNDFTTHWTPYALRGLEPGSNSLGYNQARDDWESATFKLTGLLLNGKTNPLNVENWMPLRWFVFHEDSFTAEGLSRIEIEDPHSPDSIGYNTGWGQWWEKHGLSNPVFFWSIDTRLQPIGVESLKQENYYGN